MTVWITTSETATERTQRKVKAIRVEGGLAVTPSRLADCKLAYVVTHLATGKRLTQPMPKAVALKLLPEILAIADWTLERPMIARADWDRLGLVAS